MLNRALETWIHPWSDGRAEEKNQEWRTPVDVPAPVALVAREQSIPSHGWTAKVAFHLHPNGKAAETVQRARRFTLDPNTNHRGWLSTANVDATGDVSNVPAPILHAKKRAIPHDLLSRRAVRRPSR